MGNYMQLLLIEFSMNNKQREKKMSTRDRERRLGEFWSILEHFGAEY
jgi:hypothetical protein